MGVMQDIRKIRPPIRAVLFDLDNTLVHRGESIERYAKRFLQDFSDSLTSVSRHTVARLVKRQDNGGYLPIGSPFATVRAAVVHSLAYELPWHRGVQEEEITTHWTNCFPECTVEMEGAGALCERLATLGMRLGIVSNGAEKSRRATAAQLSFAGLVSSVLSSERIGSRKPDAAIFEAAARELGVTNDECVYVGDHPINDIAGAMSAGMSAIWLQGFHPWPADLSINTPTITSLLQVLDLVTQPGTESATSAR